MGEGEAHPCPIVARGLEGIGGLGLLVLNRRQELNKPLTKQTNENKSKVVLGGGG